MNIDGENVDERHVDKMRKQRNPADIDSHHLNPITKKLLRQEFEHGYQKINKHSEGRCYGCTFNDVVRPTVADICYVCIGKRGDYKDSSLITFIATREELKCNFCGKWQIGGAQINIRLCPKCTTTVANNVKGFMREGGNMSNPFWRSIMRKQGKDWAILERQGGESWRK